MPIYVFRCSRCDDVREEIRSIRDYDAPPPVEPDVMCPETIVLDADGNIDPAHAHEAKPCDYHKAPTTFTQRWPHGTYSNDGRGGWERQGDVMIKRTAGKEKTKYGEGA